MSLVEQLIQITQRQRSADTDSSPAQAQEQHAAASEEYIRSHFRSIDFSQYEAESGTESSPIRYYRHKEQPEKRLLRLIAPGMEFPMVVTLPEKTNNPELRGMIETWENIQNRVMLDTTALTVLYRMAERYEQRQPLILEGPPGVSKTFLTWVFACMVEAPYHRLSFSSGTREGQILGSRSTKQITTSVMSTYDLIRFPLFQNEFRAAERTPEDRRSERHQTLINCLDSLIYLEEAGVPVTDAGYILTLQMLESALGKNVELIHTAEYTFDDSMLVKIVEHGGVVALDEMNVPVDPAVVEALLPLFEVNNPLLPMPSEREKGHARKHRHLWTVIAQNPPKYAGRHLLSGPMESRHHKEMLGEITEEYVKNILNFFIRGNDPNVRINGKQYQGRQDVQTRYRSLEVMPQLDRAISAIAKVFVKLNEWVDNGDIGRLKKEGGAYMFDQRDVASMLDTMLTILQRQMVDEKTGELIAIKPEDIHWGHIVKEAMTLVFLNCVTGDENDRESDYYKVMTLINTLSLWNDLKNPKTGRFIPSQYETVNTTSGKSGHAPSWD